VVVGSLDYDPANPYSEEILFTHPERICSYAEMNMELDCTKGDANRRDRYISGDQKTMGIQ
jgi:hypothetical protein